MSDVVSRLKDAAGPKGWSEDAAEIAPHLVEWRGKYQGRAKLLLKPDTTEQVSKILAICNETRTPIVPQGGNTGLVGGQIPFDNEVLLSLSRMNRIRAVDASGMNMIAEAGATLAAVQDAANKADRLFPLSIASEGSATIGGNVSTNAGGVHVLHYGNTRDLVLGVEAVLADGRVLDMLRTLRKDNTGYDLKQLFIGAEGTLGIVTAVALKLFSKPAERITAFVAVRDPQAAVDLLARLQDATGGMMSAFELMPRIGLDFVLAHVPQTSDPLSKPSPWYVLAEASGGANSHLEEAMENALAASDLVTDAVIAKSEAQRAALWKLREAMSEAARSPKAARSKARRFGADQRHPRFPERWHRRRGETGARRASRKPFGHIGDGNIHLNFSVPKGGDNAAPPSSRAGTKFRTRCTTSWRIMAAPSAPNTASAS